MTETVKDMLTHMGKTARNAAHELSLASPADKETALKAAARALRDRAADIKAANEKDMAFGREKGLSNAMLDRLFLDDDRIEGMAKGLDDIASFTDPVGAVLAEWDRPNGLHIQRVRVPLGVIGVIYESRPNVTADAGGLCLKAGNAAILRGGSESIHSSGVIVKCIRQGLREAGLNEDAVQMIPTRDRDAVGALLGLSDYVDVIVPRGGRGLIERVMDQARMPVFAHLDGLCHVYVDDKADLEKALNITLNAKMRRTGVCGSAETLLVHHDIAESFLPAVAPLLAEKSCEIRGDEGTQKLIADAHPACEEDWSTEYLDAILSVKIVDDVNAAIAHINHYGSHHTDSIVTEDQATADLFLEHVDSAICIHNASTQYADGAEFGMGAEIGISTGRMHARGPVGADQLTSFKYKVLGSGQIRP